MVEATMTEAVSEELFAEAVQLAEQASEITLRWFQSSGLEVEEKADGSPVTEADRAVEDFLRSEISSRWPEDAIVGEERDDHSGTSGRTWYIDPIDGTKSFAHGVPLYATLLALCDEQGPAIGVIALPALGETVAAARGRGCFHNGGKCTVMGGASKDISAQNSADADNAPVDSPVASSATASTATQGKSKVVCMSGMEYLSQEAKLRLAQSPYVLRTWGDAYGYFLVATGKIPAMLDDTMCPWDVAPLAVIIPEAGGRITSWAGDEIDVANCPSVLATNGAAHDELLELLSGSEKQGIAPRS